LAFIFHFTGLRHKKRSIPIDSIKERRLAGMDASKTTFLSAAVSQPLGPCDGPLVLLHFRNRSFEIKGVCFPNAYLKITHGFIHAPCG
jgi:hypothetical protein